MEASSDTGKAPIWTPTPARAASSRMVEFMEMVARRGGPPLRDYQQLHAYSVEHPGAFWRTVIDYCGVRYEHLGDRDLVGGDRMPGASWFPDARLNIARTLLASDDHMPAVVGLMEDAAPTSLSFGELRARVSRYQQAMRAAGVGVGDRVACLTPSIPDAVAAMLATVALGAVWAACSPEYGVNAAVDRIGQVQPKLMLVADGYRHGGKVYELGEKVEEILRRVPSISTAVAVPVLGVGRSMAGTVERDRFLAPYQAGGIEYESLPFQHPAYILFSSGTTGAPKCIVHGAGGAMLENLKAHALQFDVRPGDRVYMASTIGWMVWNVMAMALGCGASIVLYDGSPFHPGGDALVRHIAEQRVTFARLPARYVESLAKAGRVPRLDHDFGALKTLMCNGSPFGADGYAYVYEKVKADVHVVSPSGGTDSFGSLVSNFPIGPVWAGEIQGPALGFDIDVFDGQGNPLRGQPGELVVKRPFPSMPLHYLNDPGDKRYRETYFSVYPDVWRHGDWAEFTGHGGLIIHGRSDSTLNARGVRIGTAEIYRQLADFDDVRESVVVAQDWEGDTRVVMFVQLRDGAAFDDQMEGRIRKLLRDGLSPRHVPSKIIPVAAIPVTFTGKVSEAAVRDAIHGREPSNLGALANPESLACFEPSGLPALRAA